MEKMTRDTLFLRYPAAWWHDMWRDAMVSGNGTVGASVYGGAKDETVMLTHHKMWRHGKVHAVPDVSDAFREMRERMDREEFREASWTLVNALKDKGYEAELEEPYPVADLKLQLTPVAAFTEYMRGVHMDTGEVFSRWREGKTERRSSLFVSRADQLVVKRVVSPLRDLTVRVQLAPHSYQDGLPEEDIGAQTCASVPYLHFAARAEDGTWYGADACVSTDGEMLQERDTLLVRNAASLTVLVKVYAGREQMREDSREDIRETWTEDSYDTLLSRHAAIHGAWYGSAQLDLGTPERWHSNEELLLEAYTGEQSTEMIEKLWRYGRYLFISGTDPNADPFALYGLWSGARHPLWAHNMANENLQMVYWHVFAGNLLPFHRAVFRYYGDRLDAFRENAKRLFGMRGIYMTAGTTPGVACPNQVVPVIMNWVSAGGWLAQHYDRYARYDLDRAYVREVLLPYLLGIADFYEDFVVLDEDGKVKFYPSVSPENTPGNFMPPRHLNIPHPMPTTVNATIDLAILKECLSHLCEMAQDFPELQARVPVWERILRGIPAYRLSRDGGIREWQDDRFEERYDHRHLSHIYPVFPGTEVHRLHQRELLPAFERAVRLREIDAQTGWSMAHMAAIYARLGKGEDALESLDKMSRACLTNSFFTLHNDWRGMNISWNMDPAPVQLDAIMGYVNAVQEMLIFAAEDVLFLLPALPQRLKKGEVRDFRYPGGYIDMRWDCEQGEFHATLRAIRTHTIRLVGPEGFPAKCTGEAVKQDPENTALWQVTIQENGRVEIGT
ncbi:MAG: glycoside hydrolase N-terminal domain-containing protein [Clostridia bacterium]|nr:glycoside hydrolase N-terminal domain-containing protein [Clostridia bacterium]